MRSCLSRTWLGAAVLCLLSLSSFARPGLARGDVQPAAPVAVTLSDALLPELATRKQHSFVQLAWNGHTSEIERIRLTVHDPLAAENLNLSWTVSAKMVPSGAITGAGRVEWRKPDGLSYGPAALEATFTGTLIDGKFDGHGRYWHRSGTVYDGQWRNSLMDGQGYLHFSDGRSYEGGFQAGRFHGSGRLSTADGTVFEGSFRNGLRHGAAVQTTPDGQQFAPRWTDGAENRAERQILVRPEDLEPTPEQQTLQLDVTVGVAVDRRISGGVVGYTSRNDGARLVAFPDDDGFMQAWRGGGTIRRIDDLDSIGRFAPANFLMIVKNRGVAPVRFVGGYLAVTASQPDLNPLIEFATPFDCGEPAITTVNLKNFGWSDPVGTRITGGFVSVDGSRFILPLNVASLNGWPAPSFDLGPALEVVLLFRTVLRLS